MQPAMLHLNSRSGIARIWSPAPYTCCPHSGKAVLHHVYSNFSEQPCSLPIALKKKASNLFGILQLLQRQLWPMRLF